MRRRVAVWVVLAVTTAGCSASSVPRDTLPSASHHPRHATSAATASAATRFLNRYVTADGRVIRHDQGGDIVSEGQAYGMLIAEIANRPEVADTIWRWTAQHLRRADGLLAFHATGAGVVEDSQSAADADVLAAYALLRFRGPGAAQLRQTGRQLASAVLGIESIQVDGAPVLVAGPWAKSGTPPVVNPSYWMPSVFTALARYTRDDRWSAAATEATRLLAGLTTNGATLPPDWARLMAGRVVASGAPDGSAPVQYGLDAARLPLWYAAGCAADERALAADWWTHVLSQDDRSSFLALGLTGGPINRETNPVPLLAGGAAAATAGDARASGTLRRRAADQSRAAPTYYGDAWVALAGALADGSLAPCTDGA
jgi:endoglucanase